jgi:hypothetical protein
LAATPDFKDIHSAFGLVSKLSLGIEGNTIREATFIMERDPFGEHVYPVLSYPEIPN